ncbi:MAG: rhodanese-like domain-containing protein [Candidatus Phosphoribacter sp.]|nr:rhodanese-like domain-containing protein [Actinomycetales bacterium]
MTYAGDVTPTDTYAALAADPDAVLVDVRTKAEWTYVGLPDLAALGKDVVLTEWVSYPGGVRNDAFVDELRRAGVGEGRSIYFLCRSGVRSKHAADAATAAGLGPAYNIVDGFEGQLDAGQHRGVGGWKASGLPWRQG